MYFIYGKESFLIDKEIKKILKKYPTSKTIYFDSESLIYDVMNEINTFSIFDDQKIIVIKNFNLLFKADASKEKDFITAIDNKNENCILIFSYSDSKPKTSTPLFNYLLKNAQIKEINKYTEIQLIQLVEEIVRSKGGVISNINCIFLVTKIPNDLNLIIREIDKLLFENQEITKEMISVSVAHYNLDNIFGLINALQENDVANLFKNYYEKIENGETIVNLISQISNILILSSNIYDYKSLKINLNTIAEEMKIHIFRVKKANELLEDFGIEKIKNLIELLSTLDENIKSGLINEIIGFEKFLLEIVR